MTTDEGRAIDVLLVEDDPGDELITREAFEHNKIKTPCVARDGEGGARLPPPTRRLSGRAATGPDPAGLEPAQIRRAPTA